MVNQIREAIRHEDGLFAQRANFFLVSQALFFAAFSQVYDKTSIIVKVLILLGIITTILWLMVAIRNILLIIKLRKEEKAILFFEYGNKWKEKLLPKVGWSFMSSNNLIGIVFPVTFLIGWIIIAFNL